MIGCYVGIICMMVADDDTAKGRIMRVCDRDGLPRCCSGLFNERPHPHEETCQHRFVDAERLGSEEKDA